MTTVSLSGAALGLAPGETMTIQPLVTSFSPGLMHLLTTVDFVHANSAERVTLRFDPSVLARPIFRPRLTLGPILLGTGELARFHIAYYGGGIVAFNMFFVNASGDHIGTGKAVSLGGLDSEKIELDGDAEEIAGVPGVILGGTNTFSDSFFTASLEIIDKTTGAMKAALSSGGAGDRRLRGDGERRWRGRCGAVNQRGWRVVYDPGPPPRWKQPIWLPVQSPHRASPSASSGTRCHWPDDRRAGRSSLGGIDAGVSRNRARKGG